MVYAVTFPIDTGYELKELVFSDTGKGRKALCDFVKSAYTDGVFELNEGVTLDEVMKEVFTGHPEAAGEMSSTTKYGFYVDTFTVNGEITPDADFMGLKVEWNDIYEGRLYPATDSGHAELVKAVRRAYDEEEFFLPDDDDIDSVTKELEEYDSLALSDAWGEYGDTVDIYSFRLVA